MRSIQLTIIEALRECRFPDSPAIIHLIVSGRKEDFLNAHEMLENQIDELKQTAPFPGISPAFATVVLGYRSSKLEHLEQISEDMLRLIMGSS